MAPNRMRAITYDAYGSVDTMTLGEVAVPEPAPDEVRIAVAASSLNAWDWDLLRGKPFYARMDGVVRPKYPILGIDVSGVIDAVGDEVAEFDIGDEVYADTSGSGFGAFAEYATAKARHVAPKPERLTHLESAALPHSGILAFQGLRYRVEVHDRDGVLINGGGGGTGPIAIQLAKHWGATVTAVDSAAKADMMRSVGADRVFDYSAVDYTRTGDRYDVILDVTARRSVRAYRRALTDGGTFIAVGGSTKTLLGVGILGYLSSTRSPKKVRILPHRPSADDLAALAGLVDSGDVTPVIDDVVGLADIPRGLGRLGAGHAIGKIVIDVAGSK